MKKIDEIYNSSKNAIAHFSFEFFPPKNSEGELLLYDTVEELQALSPAFVSVTYGAGGSTRGQTLQWVETIQKKYGLPAMAHYTCIGSDRQEVRRMLQLFAQAGISNIMALRGDLPKGKPDYQAPRGGFLYASELISFIRDFGADFSVGAACYPEVHQEAASPDEDLRHLKAKVDAGVDFLVTQLFFENQVYFDFVARCRRAGISVPIVPGIMPITAFGQIERFTSMAACLIPESLRMDLAATKEDEQAFLGCSLDYSVKQCMELLEFGVPGIHFYTLNKSNATRQIVRRLIQ